MVAKQAIKDRKSWMGGGQPRTPEEAWEAHLKARQGSDNPASDSTFHMSALESGNGPPPGADTGTGTGTAPKPMLAAKLARQPAEEKRGESNGRERPEEHSLDDVNV
mmetsp:Transcript_37583/g.88827  ORF Transcript_37583/g.88827 Transcript_37583/m.88827 type:complete len:107 (+) Transcript_37583:88-408(+)